jgi:hypothetical protein
MLSDIEELARDGMREFAATIHASPDLAARTYAQHNRRRVTAYASAAGAVGAAGAAAVAVGVALPASPAGVTLPAVHPTASRTSPAVKLAAWTVTRLADGNIRVTFREATDVAGLQRTLRADGVPASVTLAGQQNSACQPYHPAGGRQALARPLGQAAGPFGGKRFMRDVRAVYDSPYAVVIDRSGCRMGPGCRSWSPERREQRTTSP